MPARSQTIETDTFDEETVVREGKQVNHNLLSRLTPKTSEQFKFDYKHSMSNESGMMDLNALGLNVDREHSNTLSPDKLAHVSKELHIGSTKKDRRH